METHRIGVISDTHGLIRPEALAALDDCDLILHAGDIGGPEVFAALESVSPVIAVRGNMDHDRWAQSLPLTQTLNVGEVSIYIQHDLMRLDINPSKSDFGMLVSGHTHKPKIEEKSGIWWINPGSAGPKRSSLPVTLVRVELLSDQIRAEIVHLLV